MQYKEVRADGLDKDPPFLPRSGSEMDVLEKV
jgi:hypothetical protein